VEVGGREERRGEERRGEERRGMGEKERDGAVEENNVQRNMVREKTARGGWSGSKERARRIMVEKEAEGKRGELCICTYMYVCVVYMYVRIYECM